jgi:hypothetical protein
MAWTNDIPRSIAPPGKTCLENALGAATVTAREHGHARKASNTYFATQLLLRAPDRVAQIFPDNILKILRRS